MVRPEGVEPPTYWFVASCSIQLSYGRTLLGSNCLSIPEGPVEINLTTGARWVCGAPGRIRTSDPLVRSQMLYPTELRARGGLATDDCTAGAGLAFRCPTSQRRDVGHPVWSQSRVGVCLPADPHLRGEMWGTQFGVRAGLEFAFRRTHISEARCGAPGRPGCVDEPQGIAARSETQVSPLRTHDEAVRSSVEMTLYGLHARDGARGRVVGARVRLWGRGVGLWGRGSGCGGGSRLGG